MPELAEIDPGAGQRLELQLTPQHRWGTDGVAFSGGALRPTTTALLSVVVAALPP